MQTSLHWQSSSDKQLEWCYWRSNQELVATTRYYKHLWNLSHQRSIRRTIVSTSCRNPLHHAYCLKNLSSALHELYISHYVEATVRFSACFEQTIWFIYIYSISICTCIYEQAAHRMVCQPPLHGPTQRQRSSVSQSMILIQDVHVQYTYVFKHWITWKKGATTIFVVKKFMKTSQTFDRLRFSSIGEQKKFL